MMHGQRALSVPWRTAHAATPSIAIQHLFAHTPEIQRILPLECVAGCAQAARQHLRMPTSAVHRSLCALPHFPTPADTSPWTIRCSVVFEILNCFVISLIGTEWSL